MRFADYWSSISVSIEEWSTGMRYGMSSSLQEMKDSSEAMCDFLISNYKLKKMHSEPDLSLLPLCIEKDIFHYDELDFMRYTISILRDNSFGLIICWRGTRNNE